MLDKRHEGHGMDEIRGKSDLSSRTLTAKKLDKDRQEADTKKRPLKGLAI
jgi:hypothetical protein